MSKIIKITVLLSICVSFIHPAKAQNFSVKIFRELIFLPSVESVDTVLKPYHFSFSKKGKLNNNNTRYDYYIFEKLDSAAGIKEQVAVLKDSNTTQTAIPTIRYVSNSAGHFNEMENELDSIPNVKAISVSNSGGCFIREFNLGLIYYDFSVCEDEKIGKIYIVTVTIPL